jgi:hypothetical protein
MCFGNYSTERLAICTRNTRTGIDRHSMVAVACRCGEDLAAYRAAGRSICA